MKSKIAILLVSLMVTLNFLSGSSLSEIKQEMQKRLPTITNFKSEGLVGENNKGYLEVRASISADKKKIVDDENRDRKIVYQEIASKVGGSLDTISLKRAQQIRESSPSGVWVQLPNGNWTKK